jgi:hypothetical protein
MSYYDAMSQKSRAGTMSRAKSRGDKRILRYNGHKRDYHYSNQGDYEFDKKSPSEEPVYPYRYDRINKVNVLQSIPKYAMSNVKINPKSLRYLDGDPDARLRSVSISKSTMEKYRPET